MEKSDSSYSFQFNEMARPAGLEPAPFCLEGRRSIQLSYGRAATTLILEHFWCERASYGVARQVKSNYRSEYWMGPDVLWLLAGFFIAPIYGRAALQTMPKGASRTNAEFSGWNEAKGTHWAAQNCRRNTSPAALLA
jgi:hypothetical protein